MKNIIYIIGLMLIAQISFAQMTKRATDFPGEYIDYADPNDILNQNFHHRFHGSNVTCAEFGWFALFGTENLMFEASTGGDGAGESVDSIVFYVDSLSGSFDCIWAIREKSEAGGQLGKIIALQDNPMTVSSAGLQSATGWTMQEGNTLSNYKKYWLIMEHNATVGDDVLIPIGDIQSQGQNMHIFFTFDDIPSVTYTGTIHDSVDYLELFVMSAAQVERMPVNLFYTTSSSVSVNLVKTFSGITSSQFSLNLNWNNDDGNMAAFMYGSQGQWWLQDFPCYSVHPEYGDIIWGTSDSERIINVTEPPAIPPTVGTYSSWDVDFDFPDPPISLIPGLPFKAQIILEYDNGNYWLPIFIDTFFTIRIKNIYINNHVSTDTMGTDSLNLWAHRDSLGAFNPTQEDSITIKTGDVLHIIQRTFSDGTCEIAVESADFDGDFDTTFAHIEIESGGILEMHGDTRINILTLINNGEIIFTPTDSLFVGDAPFANYENILWEKRVK